MARIIINDVDPSEADEIVDAISERFGLLAEVTA